MAIDVNQVKSLLETHLDPPERIRFDHQRPASRGLVVGQRHGRPLVQRPAHVIPCDAKQLGQDRRPFRPVPSGIVNDRHEHVLRHVVRHRM
jgi:hypothetical protein